jgi:hypothetical protein
MADRKTATPAQPSGNSVLRKEAIAFLGRDYEQVFLQLRFYDGQIWEITKFTFLELIASVAAVWTLFNFSHSKDIADTFASEFINAWKIFGGGILVISFVFSLLAAFHIMRNRKYFTRAAHYINDQRKFFLDVQPLGFQNESNYYTKITHPAAFEPESTHWLSVVVILLTGSLMLGFGIGLVAQYTGISLTPAIILGAAFSVLGFISEFSIAKWFQKEKEKDEEENGGSGRGK